MWRTCGRQCSAGTFWVNPHETVHVAVPSGGFGTPIMTVLPARVRSRVHAATSGIGSNTVGRTPFPSLAC